MSFGFQEALTRASGRSQLYAFADSGAEGISSRAQGLGSRDWGLGSRDWGLGLGFGH